jgi:uncharacterized protein (TIGR02145 family)
MKKLIFLNLFLINSFVIYAQAYNMKIKKTDNSTTTYLTSDISEITFTYACGTNTVSYGGTTYNTVLIGNQCWLKENLNVGTRINGSSDQTNNSTIEKYCYNDNESNCTTYGGLYKWNEAMAYSTTPGTQGICPTGWHIPTAAEFSTLTTTVHDSSNALKAVGQGAGTNTSGFSAMLSGQYNNTSFLYITLGTQIWSSSGSYLQMNTGNSLDTQQCSGEGCTPLGFTVRCLKD